MDATCPLVTKVHNEIKRYYDKGYKIIMIGHHGHPETIGTMGQLPEGEVYAGRKYGRCRENGSI